MQIRPTVSNTVSVGELPEGIDSHIPALCSPFDRLFPLGSSVESAPQFSTDLLVGAVPILSVKAELDELRSRCNQQDDLTTDIDYFLSCKHPRNCRPVVLILRNKSRAAAAVFLHEVCFVWLGTGLCGAGDSAGDGLLIAPAEEREVFLRRAIDELINVQKRFHTVRLRVKTLSGAALVGYAASGINSKLIERTVKHTFPLAGSYADMLASFGLRTRRSLRTKRRQLEEALRPDFFSSLAPEQAMDAMRYLRPRSSSFARSMWYFESRRKFLKSRSDAFAMALRSHDGTWLSFLSGWRRNGTTYVDMQLNHSAFKRESLSAVMRAFLLEHEIGAGQKYITFVGGCSSLLERYCSPEEAVVDLLVTRISIRGWCLKQAIRRFCERSFSQWIYF
jgi:hypothetical protein